MQKNKRIKWVKSLPRQWKVSIDIKPNGRVNGWSNILQGTIGGSNWRLGDRIPLIHFRSRSTRLHICCAIGKNKNHCFNSKPIPLNKFTKVVIRQFQEREKDGKYVYRINIGGKIVYEIVNTNPKVYKKVSYYASNPWHKPANAVIRNFELTTYTDKNHA